MKTEDVEVTADFGRNAKGDEKVATGACAARAGEDISTRPPKRVDAPWGRGACDPFSSASFDEPKPRAEIGNAPLISPKVGARPKRLSFEEAPPGDRPAEKLVLGAPPKDGAPFREVSPPPRGAWNEGPPLHGRFALLVDVEPNAGLASGRPKIERALASWPP